MNFKTSVQALATIAIVTLLFIKVIEAGDKKGGDLLIMGGDDGCPPKLLLKTGDKKSKTGDILFMSPCKKKKETKYIAYPVYQEHEYGHESQGYD